MRRFIMLFTIVAIGGVLAMASSAAAAPFPPTSEELPTIENDIVLVDCGRFNIRDDFVLEATQTTYYDRNGEPIRIRTHFTGVDRFYDSKTGKEYTDTTANTIDFVDLQSGQTRAVGVEFHLTVSGVVVVIDAGRLIFNGHGEVVFQAGKHQLLSSEPDTAKFCEVMADP
jgi:hypothetical protein